MIVKMIWRIMAENIALRQQLAVYQRKTPHPKIKHRDRIFWVLFKKICAGAKSLESDFI